MNQIDLLTAARRLAGAERILLLTHRRPDGDTVGSAAALCRGLRALGKEAWVCPNRDLTPRLAFLLEGLTAPDAFVPDLVCAVDVADPALLTPEMVKRAPRTDLCVDHHPSNTGYAREVLLYPQAAAAGEAVWRLLDTMGVAVDEPMWEALYIAVATDTGCFQFSNTTPLCHRLAAQAIEAGVDFHKYNRIFFQTKSRCRFLVERRLFDSLTFSPDGRTVVGWLERAWLDSIGATDDDLDNLSTLTMSLEGVECGAILTQNREDSGYKVSVRTHAPYDASRICARFGGGGHPRAAGCTVEGPGAQAARTLAAEMEEELARC